MTRASILDKLIWLGVALVALGFLGYGYASNEYRRAHAIRSDGCFAHQPYPEVLSVATDVTDPLEPAQPRRWLASVSGEISAAPAGTKLLFVAIGDKAPAEVSFDSGPCVPPQGSGIELSRIRESLSATVGRAEQRLKDAEPMKHSAILGTILAIAEDPAFKVANARRLVVLSDLLECEGRLTAYRRSGFRLPDPDGQPLKGVTLDIYVLKNPRDLRFQTPALVAAWVAWARAAGATVRVDAPSLGRQES